MKISRCHVFKTKFANDCYDDKVCVFLFLQPGDDSATIKTLIGSLEDSVKECEQLLLHLNNSVLVGKNLPTVSEVMQNCFAYLKLVQFLTSYSVCVRFSLASTCFFSYWSAQNASVMF